ncbi:hypothetical protein KTT_09550 [Tengunoibacter tsumagoiensis]|uniref:Uncharacterized protein n=1 Tax=Tengunoibacter tsumagoiensis TaxID=2014871 RepID=A0A401ZWB2_9CHLR|nr:hypothetical protein KTT_09550 [Tengunoibacter tsumagoiensis]
MLYRILKLSHKQRYALDILLCLWYSLASSKEMYYTTHEVLTFPLGLVVLYTLFGLLAGTS